MHPKTLRIQFTGGPHGGKTSMVQMVKDRLEQLGYVVLVVPEAATQYIQVLGSSVHNIISGVAGTHAFQVALSRSQIVMEKGSEELAVHAAVAMEGKTMVMLFDRGVLDGKGFVGTEKMWDAVVAELGYKLDPLTGREVGQPAFDTILHMESCGAHDPKWYQVHSRSTKTLRLQDREAAARADTLLGKVYENFKGYVFVPFYEEYDKKCAHVLGIIEALLLQSEGQ